MNLKQRIVALGEKIEALLGGGARSWCRFVTPPGQPVPTAAELEAAGATEEQRAMVATVAAMDRATASPPASPN